MISYRQLLALLPVIALIYGFVCGVPAFAGPYGPASDLEISRVGFGSCISDKGDRTFWSTLQAANLDLFLFLGDNVYGDDEEAGLPRLTAAYERLAADPGFEKFTARVPTLATWDDHDYGRNDGGATYPHRATSEKIFQSFWASAGPLRKEVSRDDAAGIYHARIMGPEGARVQVILLDTRSFRSDLTRRSRQQAREVLGQPGRYIQNTAPGSTMLGDDQWRWLAEELRKPAEIRLIVSSVQVLADGHTYERWGNLPRERQRLFDLIDDTGASGVIFLSGDRHRGAIYRLDRGRIGDGEMHGNGKRRYPFYEVTSSSLNRTLPGSEPGPNRLTGMVTDNNFGRIEIDWAGRSLELHLSGMDGGTLATHIVSFAELGLGAP